MLRLERGSQALLCHELGSRLALALRRGELRRGLGSLAQLALLALGRLSVVASHLGRLLGGECLVPGAVRFRSSCKGVAACRVGLVALAQGSNALLLRLATLALRLLTLAQGLRALALGLRGACSSLAISKTPQSAMATSIASPSASPAILGPEVQPEGLPCA